MTTRRKVGAAALVAALAIAPVAATSLSAQAAPGTKSLASVLLKDTKGGKPSFDKNGRDFDILTAAVLGVLAADPSSPVSVLTDGNVRLTAFLPTDRAFVRTGKVLGLKAKSEGALAGKYVDALGVDGLESVLLYHVIPGVTITAKDAAKSDGAVLTTALGQKVKVNVTKNGIYLKDGNRDVADPKVVITDINKGNKQIAHGINGVLLPKM